VTSSFFQITHNSFNLVGQAPIDFSNAGASVSGEVSNNTFLNISAISNFGFLGNSAMTNCAFNGNVFATTTALNAIDLAGASDNIFIGNMGANAIIDRGGGASNLGTTANNNIDSLV
jgi:hypothetical protein